LEDGRYGTGRLGGVVSLLEADGILEEEVSKSKTGGKGVKI